MFVFCLYKKITVSGNVEISLIIHLHSKFFDYMINGKLIICSDLPVLRGLKNNFNSILAKISIIWTNG